MVCHLLDCLYFEFRDWLGGRGTGLNLNVVISWKPCAAALPDEGMSVFIHNKFWDDIDVTIGFLDAGHWFYEADDCRPCQPPPTHWAEWPAPPSEEEDRGQKTENKMEVTIPGLMPPTTNAISPRTGV